MASDDILQRSVRLLDDAVGSPSLYRSPRQSRPRSSLFTNTRIPTASEVRDFAFNNLSVSMNTSELDGFMLDTTLNSPAVSMTSAAQQSVVKQVSDNLYQHFLEAMETHSTAGQVFDIIADFIQTCGNTLDLMRDNHNQKDVEWLELERNTWRLILALYQNRLGPEVQGEVDGEGEMAVDVICVPSERDIVENYYKTNPKIREYQLVVDWLEKNTADLADSRNGPKLHHFMDNTVAWENTLHQLQNNETVAYRSSRAIVTELDPDAPLRTSKPLHDLDMEDEARLLRQVFAELRCGRHDRAAQLCQHCGQLWRAATLEGWRLHHDPNYANPNTTEKLPVQGNPNRDIWKLCAWRLCENVRAGVYARAVHGALCGHLGALMPACTTWEDLLWAQVRVTVDGMVEREIRDNSLRDYTPMPDAYWQHRLSMEEVFASLDGSADASVRAQACAWERVVQKLLILDRVGVLVGHMRQWASAPDAPPHTLRCLAHIALMLRHLGQPVHGDADDIVTAYVKVLMKQQDARLVAHYTATLPPDDQVALFAQFLQRIEQTTLRRDALEAAEGVGLPIEAITQRVVENVRNEEGSRAGAGLGLASEVTAEDRRKVSALEWVVMYPSQRAEALWQTNALIRTFLALGKTQAARLAFDQIPADSIDQVLNQFQVDDDAVSVYSDCLPSRVSASIQEYLSHKAYLDAQEGFADWFEHYHHARPSPPPLPPPGATFTEKVAHDHRQAAHRRDFDRWQAAMDHQTKCVTQQLYNVVLFPKGGWLCDTDGEDPLRAQQMKALRTLCVPKIVLLLHTVLHSMGHFKEAVQLADLIVDEKHKLYQVYSKQQMTELLSKIRESSLASLAQERDPWGHPVTS